MRVAALTIAATTLAACASASRGERESAGTPPAGPRVAQLTRQATVDADGRLGADLLAALGRDGNEVISPYSIAVALQMALAGAKGETAAQMANVLHLPSPDAASLSTAAAELARDLNALNDPRTRMVLRIANQLWPQSGYPLEPAFTTIMHNGFGTAVKQLDYGRDPERARHTINEAVADATNGKIQQLLAQPLDPTTRLVLTGAIYLKARWSSPFDAAQTRRQDLRTSAGANVQVPFMHQTAQLGYAKGDGYRLVRLPYGLGALAMTLIVPDASLAPVESLLARRGLAALIGNVGPATVDLALPKFTVQTHTDLNDVLSRLGMVDAFTARADFSGMTRAERLMIAQVAHEAYLSADENGTEAAAATGVVMTPVAGRVAPPVAISVDHPFLFTISDARTGTPLFLGRVTDPSAG